MALFFPVTHPLLLFFFFFFNDTATTEIYTLSLHDALPICKPPRATTRPLPASSDHQNLGHSSAAAEHRSEEHTSELQSRLHLVCRLLLEKKKKNTTDILHSQPQQQLPATTYDAY